MLALLCLLGLTACATQSAEELAAQEKRLAGLRVDTFNGLRVICLQAPPAGCPSTTASPFMINDTDKSTFVALVDKGPSASGFRANQTLVNRRAFVFASSFSNNRDIEILVNAEDNPDINQARQKAVELATVLGRMPSCVLKEVKEAKIQNSSGVGLDRGGVPASALPATSSIFIFEDIWGRTKQDRSSEEVLLHELAHILFDNSNTGYATAAYKNAVAADGAYVSRYAAGIVATTGAQGDREDVAESFVAYYGAKFRAERVGAFFTNSVKTAIPNRFAYFEKFCPTV